MPKVYLTKKAKEPSPIEIEKEKMVIKPVHSSAFKIKERGDTENSTNTKKEKELSEKITSECMSLPIKKKLFEGKEEVTIFKNSSKKRDTKTAKPIKTVPRKGGSINFQKSSKLRKTKKETGDWAFAKIFSIRLKIFSLRLERRNGKSHV